MLKQMRSGAHSGLIKGVLFGLLLLGSLGMALGLGVGDIFRSRTHSTTLASIGSDAISKNEFDRILQDALRDKKISQDDAYREGLTEQTLRREVNSRLFIRAAADLGIIVDDGTARRQLDSLLEPMVKKGMTERDALNEILYSFNTNESRLVGSLKAEIAVEKLSHALADGAKAPPQMVNDFLKFRYEARRGEYLKFTAADAAVKDPSDAELKTFYTTMQAHYMQPEYRSFAVLVLDRKALGGKNAPTADDVKAYYDQHKDLFATPARRVVSEISTADKDLADKLYAAAQKKKDLKAVAAAGGKNASFVTGTFSQEDFMPSELTADVFHAEVGALMPPAKSSLGWHIVRVEKTLPADTKSLEEAKADIEKALGANSNDSNEEMYNRVNEADDMIGGGKTLSEVAQSFKVKEIAFDKIDSHGLNAAGKKADTQGVPGFDKVLAAAFKLDKGAESQLLQAPTGEFTVAETREIVPAEMKPFDTVRAEVLQAWKDKQAGDTLDAKAQKIVEQLKEGKSLDSVAADLGKTVQKTPLLSRNTPPIKSGMDPALMMAMFSIDKVGQATAVPSPGAVTILRLAERKAEAPAQPTKEEVESLQSLLSQAMQSDILDQFRRSLMAKYDAHIDEGVLKQQYEPKAEDQGTE